MSDHPIVKGLKGVGLTVIVIGTLAVMAAVYLAMFFIGLVYVIIRLIGACFWHLLPVAILIFLGVLSYKILQY